jgi:predicted transcriptional regulator
MDGLGQLEAAVMDVLWGAPEPWRVRDVVERLAPERTLAYTTVMTVLENLHRKGWVMRELDGKAYRYEPALTREEAAARAMRRVLDETGDPEAALLHFARTASEREQAALRKALDRRRRRP